jgi:RNA polymerase sigma-70 factor (ECF subfamily)
MQTAAEMAVPQGATPTALDDFDAIVAAHWPGIFRFALASLRDPDAAATVAQDCFVRAHRAREQFRGESGVRTWLIQIAVNLVRDAARNRRLQFWKRWSESEPDSQILVDGGMSPEAGAAAKEELRAVWRAVRRLPERQRTVFLLRFSEEMALSEIAAATGMAEGTVKVHLFRAVRAVREAVGREG